MDGGKGGPMRTGDGGGGKGGGPYGGGGKGKGKGRGGGGGGGGGGGRWGGPGRGVKLDRAKNDFSQHFVDTRERPANFVRDADVNDRFDEYPRLKELINGKDTLVAERASEPMFKRADLRTFDLTTLGTKFDVVLIDPPWEEYRRRAMAAGDHEAENMEVWSPKDIMALRIEAITETPSFCFLWCGTGQGLDWGRHCLKKWGFRRCEDAISIPGLPPAPTPVARRHPALTSALATLDQVRGHHVDQVQPRERPQPRLPPQLGRDADVGALPDGHQGDCAPQLRRPHHPRQRRHRRDGQRGAAVRCQTSAAHPSAACWSGSASAPHAPLTAAPQVWRHREAQGAVRDCRALLQLPPPPRALWPRQQHPSRLADAR